MIGLRIGPVVEDRLAECLVVLQDGFATETARFGLTAENTPSNPAFWGAAELQQVLDHGSQLYAAFVADELRGCAFVGPSPSRKGVWVLKHLTVGPSARHLGIGAALVAEGADRARRAGAHTLRIGIVAANARLSDWYHGLGFVTLESNDYPGLVFTVDHLELKL